VSQERPDALLKSALEKIVYFEARAEQLTNDVSTASAERERLRTDLAQASQREIDLRRVIAELEVRSTRAHAEREEAATLAEALRRERAELLGKILEASRINTEGNDPFDLASFIAELRSEVLLRRERDAAPSSGPVAIAVAPMPAPPAEAPKPTHVENEAAWLKSQGRLSVSTTELASLERAFQFPGRTEETLFGFSVRELSAPDASARARAAERLTALAHPAAAPALATALHAETEPMVKVALLAALSTLAKVEAIPVVVPQLTSPSPDVRIAALKALLKLDPTQAGPHLAAAVKDPDAAVRRRASLLALGLRGTAALELGETAIRDSNTEVRSLAALVLGASGVESARPWLMQAMRDPEVRVRRSASQALSRLLGQDVSELVDLDEAQRRREVRRLAHVQANPVKAKVVAALPRVPPADSPKTTLPTLGSPGAIAAGLARVAAPQPQTATARAPSVVEPVAHSSTPVAPNDASPIEAERSSSSPQRRPVVASAAPTLHPMAPSAAVALVTAPARVAVLEVEVERAVTPAPLEAVMVELRTAIRGQTADGLCASLNASLESVRAACAALIHQGLVVRRGHKYFVA
jgi:hypothetical protein